MGLSEPNDYSLWASHCDAAESPRQVLREESARNSPDVRTQRASQLPERQVQAGQRLLLRHHRLWMYVRHELQVPFPSSADGIKRTDRNFGGLVSRKVNAEMIGLP